LNNTNANYNTIQLSHVAVSDIIESRVCFWNSTISLIQHLISASVPGQQVPDQGVMKARQRKKDNDRLKGETLGIKNFCSSGGGGGGVSSVKKHFYYPTEEELGLDLSYDRAKLGKVGM